MVNVSCSLMEQRIIKQQQKKRKHNNGNIVIEDLLIKEHLEYLKE